MFKRLIIVLAALAVVGPLAGQAAAWRFQAKTQAPVGQPTEIQVFVDTQGEEINAVEGQLVFSPDRLTVSEVRDGNSLVSLWVERPRVGEGTVSFSGVIPGGYTGQRGQLFSLVVQPVQAGTVSLSLKTGQVLLNDGRGTSRNLAAANLYLTSDITSVKETTVNALKDQERPETFTPLITSDSSLFNGQWFLVFSTSDKGSGLDRYEVKEERPLGWSSLFQKKNWLTVTSPYLLTDQALRSFIYVKAVDQQGNERLVVLPPRFSLVLWDNYWFWVILALVAGMAVYWRRYRK